MDSAAAVDVGEFLGHRRRWRLEPAYEVAGGSLDYAVDAGVERFAVLDGMGHGIVSAQLISLVVAAYRNARCAGQWRSRNQTTAVTTGMVTKWVM